MSFVIFYKFCLVIGALIAGYLIPIFYLYANHKDEPEYYIVGFACTIFVFCLGMLVSYI